MLWISNKERLEHKQLINLAYQKLFELCFLSERVLNR
jgi:hypothetical protein